MASKLYLTTTLPYVNAEPHLGFALELVQADVVARYHQLLGQSVFFNTGTDEHGVKIYRRAQEVGQEPQVFVAAAAQKFKDLIPALGVLPEINFIRTTAPEHITAAQEFWRRCEASGDIYKKNYRLKYCVGCELEKTESELENGRCLVHPNLELEVIEEENYFFRFSKYQKQLLELYASRPDFVVPAPRFTEVKKFVERGLEDFSISRLKSKMPWGIEVPGDETQVMYVWFDALVNYIAAVGWPNDLEKFNQWWPAIQLAGKDNLRQQAAMWQAMLKSAGLSPSRQIVIHGFIISGGQKMSKSLGNVIDPFALVRDYGTDAVRYFLLRHVNPFEDSDVTPEKFKEAYNANLANGLGNLVSRVMKMAEKYFNAPVMTADVIRGVNFEPPTLRAEYDGYLQNFEFNRALDLIWGIISQADQKIQKNQPFKIFSTSPELARETVKGVLFDLNTVSFLLKPILSDTADKIKVAILANRALDKPLFPRK
jgi:methionyl-tRNA synthetase